MFFAQQVPKILSLTVFLENASTACQSFQAGLKAASLIWATTQSYCLIFYLQMLPKSCWTLQRISANPFFRCPLEVCLHRFCPKRKFSTCAAPQKVVGLCKVVAQSRDSPPNTAPSQPFYFQNHFPKAASQRCYQLPPKDINCSMPNLSNIKPKRLPTAMLDSGSRKTAPQSCYVWPPEVVSERATPQSCCPSRKMSFSAAVPQSAFAKQRLQSGSASNLFFPCYYPQWLPKSASQTFHDYRTSIQTWFVRQCCGSS